MSADGLPTMTRAVLARFDGGRRPAYVAVDGLVYDVSASAEWRGGLHRNLHWAGQDLSDELGDAPHGRAVLARCPCVARLLPELPETAAPG